MSKHSSSVTPMDFAVQESQGNRNTTNVEDMDCQRFPFLNTKQPDGLFCSYMKTDVLYSILEAQCIGKNSVELNSLPCVVAWKTADEEYFFPWVQSMKISDFSYDDNNEDEKESEITLKMIYNELAEIHESIKSSSIKATDSEKLILAVYAIKDKLAGVLTTHRIG